MGFLLVSPATCWRSEFRRARWAMLFALSAIGIYLAAVVDLYIRLPVYSACKATYLLGLLPCIAVLAAAGAAPLLHYRLLRALVFAAVACWGFASYVAYFDSSAIRWLLGAGRDAFANRLFPHNFVMILREVRLIPVRTSS